MLSETIYISHKPVSTAACQLLRNILESLTNTYLMTAENPKCTTLVGAFLHRGERVVPQKDKVNLSYFVSKPEHWQIAQELVNQFVAPALDQLSSISKGLHPTFTALPGKNNLFLNV